jgi:uncharacterized protein
MPESIAKTILWTSSTLHSAEYFTLKGWSEGYLLDGTINTLLDGQPTQIVYSIDCDQDWITRRVALRQYTAQGEQRLFLTVDAALNWYSDGVLIPWAAGLTDVDLSVTPATNMLPIRKHQLQIGEKREVNCVWVQPPTLELATLPQHYTRIDARHYDYAAPTLDYTAMLTVDEDGVIIQYGDLWEQAGR